MKEPAGHKAAVNHSRHHAIMHEEEANRAVGPVDVPHHPVKLRADIWAEVP